jgi:hypothetical protein
MEGIRTLRDLLRAGDWIYFMLPIHDEDRAFLKFVLHIPVKVSTFQPAMHPLGLHQEPEAYHCPAGYVADDC